MNGFQQEVIPKNNTGDGFSVLETATPITRRISVFVILAERAKRPMFTTATTALLRPTTHLGTKRFTAMMYWADKFRKQMPTAIPPEKAMMPTEMFSASPMPKAIYSKRLYTTKTITRFRSQTQREIP